jgi:O-antigen ligase
MALSIVISILHSGITPGKIGFADAFGGNYVIAGRTIGTALIILVFYFLDSTKNKIVKLFYLGLITLMIFGMFITGARAPLMAVGLSLLVVYSMNFIKFLDTKRVSKKAVVKIATLLGIVLFLLIRFSNYFSTVFFRLGLLKAQDYKESIFLSAISERLELSEYAVNAMFRFPFGLGFGGFTQWYNGGNTGIQFLYPHNLFLELGAEGGLLGLLAILLLVIKSFFNVLSNSSLFFLQNKPLKDTLLGLLVFMIFNSTVSGELNDDRTLFALIGLIDAVKKIR